jgi:hypothetical protein
VQLAGAVNVARRARVQLGVINISDDPETIQIGVLGIVRGGRTDVEASIDSSAVGTALLRHGGRRWHGVYGVGGQRAGAGTDEMLGAREDVWMYGLGMGPSWQRGALRTDVEAIAWQVNHGAGHDGELSLLAQLRATFAWSLGEVGVVAGVAANTYIRTALERGPLKIAIDGDLDDRTGVVRIWPTAFVGVRM